MYFAPKILIIIHCKDETLVGEVQSVPKVQTNGRRPCALGSHSMKRETALLVSRIIAVVNSFTQFVPGHTISMRLDRLSARR